MIHYHCRMLNDPATRLTHINYSCLFVMYLTDPGLWGPALVILLFLCLKKSSVWSNLTKKTDFVGSIVLLCQRPHKDPPVSPIHLTLNPLSITPLVTSACVLSWWTTVRGPVYKPTKACHIPLANAKKRPVSQKGALSEKWHLTPSQRIGCSAHDLVALA